MRRSVQLLAGRPRARVDCLPLSARHVTSLAPHSSRYTQPSLLFHPIPLTSIHTFALFEAAAPCSRTTGLVLTDASACRRFLSTSLPSAGAPATPSPSPPHTHTPPASSHSQQQPAVGAHPPHSSAPASPASRPASVASSHSAAGDVRLTAPAPPDSAAPSPAPPANESRLRRLIRQYGAVAVGSYLVIYVSTLGMLYVAVAERWLGGYDIQHVVDALGLSQHMEHVDPRKGDFAVAWIATKFTEPLRLALTAAITPAVARMVGRAPPKEGPSVQAAVEQRMKDGIEQAKDTVAEKIKERSNKP